MQLSEVQPGDVLKIIKARADTPVTAERIRVIVQQFYNHAIRNLMVTTNPAQPLRGAIVRAPVKHHRHLSEKELAAFWRKLDQQGAHVTTIAASRLLTLTMARKGDMYDFDVGADNRHRGASRAAVSGCVNQAPFVNASHSSRNLSRD